MKSFSSLMRDARAKQTGRRQPNDKSADSISASLTRVRQLVRDTEEMCAKSDARVRG